MTVNSILVKEEGQEQLPVYYVSKSPQGVETRYFDMEKLVIALVKAS